MNFFKFSLLLLVFCTLYQVSSCQSTIGNADSPYTLQEAFPGLTIQSPVEMAFAGDGTDRLFILAQRGEIHVFPNQAGTNSSKVFMDIKDRVEFGGEMGLLGLAFHPDFKNNGYFYVNYTKSNPRETVVSRFKAINNNSQGDPKSEMVLLRFEQPYSNHNGGKIEFGADGFLYIATGDGGSGGDPLNAGQDKKTMLGKILRIDVNKASNNRNYSIPADNPFAGNKNGWKEEIYAFGLRNPWRFSFDRETNRLWAGDVGQNRIEEINIIEKGGNYGWRIMEASECFDPKNNCKTEGLILPVHEYHQSTGAGQSVTGGYVYRGKEIPALQGKYIYGDYQSGNIWALDYKENGASNNTHIISSRILISSFGEDSENEIYILSHADGKIYKLVEKK